MSFCLRQVHSAARIADKSKLTSKSHAGQAGRLGPDCPDLVIPLIGRGVIGAMVVVIMVVASSCDQRSTNSDPRAEDFTPRYGAPGQPLPGQLADVIEIDTRIGIDVSVNRILNLSLSDDTPPRVIDGREAFTGNVSSSSRALRVSEFAEPVGSKLVQVDVNLDSPLSLRKVSGDERDRFVPGPVLQDSIRNTYWPCGYILQTDAPDRADVTTEIHLNRADPIKDLNDLPRLSKNKPQKLTLLYFVNRGVTIESFSYGGEQPKFTFELQIPNQ